MNIQLLVTLGPNSMSESVLSRLADIGVSIFRINLSHTSIADLPGVIDHISSITSVPICLDTEGAQVRVGDLEREAVVLNENTTVFATRTKRKSDSGTLSFYPKFAVDLMDIGDLIGIEFGTAILQVIERNRDEVSFSVVKGGTIHKNKACTINPLKDLPALTDKDRHAITIGLDKGLRHFALSFAGSGADVDLMRNLCGNDSFIISKIESVNGLIHLGDIASRSDAILIDRGDLSQELSVERIPVVQKHIIKTANAIDTPVYVATNFLDSMITKSKPTSAEIGDLLSALDLGADGVVLAAETAIGNYPIACATLARSVIENINDLRDRVVFGPDDIDISLVPPHGGALVHREASNAEIEMSSSLRQIEVSPESLIDCEHITNGTYSPLCGFMDREAVESVLVDNRLPDGTIWTMPIVLQLNNSRNLPASDECIVLVGLDRQPRFLMNVTDVYKVDISSILKLWFGTADVTHPGVAHVSNGGHFFVAGEVSIIGRHRSYFQNLTFTPSQTRQIFSSKGWSQIVGFHTRNPPHRVHEYIQLRALEETNADGLYINPIVGSVKKGDIQPNLVMGGYRTLIREGIYPANKVTVGGFLSYSRFCGPREAIFTALVRKNMGCSHFIIGHDHAGFGNYYTDDDSRHLSERLGDLGIKLLFFEKIGFNIEHGSYEPETSSGPIHSISGTNVRDELESGRALPEWIIHQSVQNLLRDTIESGKSIFY